MSTKKITALTELTTTPATGDLFPVVDVSDTTDASSGTTKSIKPATVFKAAGIGAGNTTAEPVKIDTSNGRLGVGTNSPVNELHVTGAANNAATAHILNTDTSNGNGVLITGGGSNASKYALQVKDGAGTALAYVSSTTASNGFLGLGTTTPSNHLHVVGTSADVRIQVNGGEASTTTGGGMLRLVGYHSGSGVAGYAEVGIVIPAGGDGELVFRTTTNASGGLTEQMRIDKDGNVLIGGTATPTSSVGNMCLFNGTIPAASVANGVVVYAEDATGSSELKVRDEAGNVSTLSPHNFDMLGDRSESMAWSYSSKNVFVGKEIAVDMTKVIRDLEKLTGESYIKIRDIDDSEKLDWATEQKKYEEERKQDIDSYKTRKVDADKEKSDFDEQWGTLPTSSSTKTEVKAFLDGKNIEYEDGTKDELFAKVPEKPEFTESEPAVYSKVSKPSWIA